MIVKRTQAIKGVVIQREDLRRISNLLVSLVASISSPETGKPPLRFSVWCSNSMQFESDSPSVFDDNPVLEVKNAYAVVMAFHDWSADHHVEIDLTHGGTNHSTNFVKVWGSDQLWVNGVITQLVETIQGAQPQSDWHRRLAWLWVNAAALGIGQVVLTLMTALLFDPFLSPLLEGRPAPQWVVFIHQNLPIFWYFIPYFATWLTGLPLAMRMYAAVGEMWPDVELQLGPPHRYLEKNRRSKAAKVWSAAMLPILLRLAYDLVRGLSS